MSKALICPRCGGRLEKDKSKCPWCGTEIDLKDDENTLNIVIKQPKITEADKVGETYLLHKSTNYNTESNSDFSSKYHYKFKNRKKKILTFVVIVIIIIAVAIAVYNNMEI